jgi:hypothetical protein
MSNTTPSKALSTAPPMTNVKSKTYEMTMIGKPSPMGKLQARLFIKTSASHTSRSPHIHKMLKPYQTSEGQMK